MSNISVPHSVLKPPIRRVETTVKGGKQRAALSLSCFVALFSVLNVFRNRLLTVYVLVVVNGINYDVVVGPSR